MTCYEDMRIRPALPKYDEIESILTEYAKDWDTLYTQPLNMAIHYLRRSRAILKDFIEDEWGEVGTSASRVTEK